MARAGRTSTLVGVAELFNSDFTLIGAALAGLALTALGILHDLAPFRLNNVQTAKVGSERDTA